LAAAGFDAALEEVARDGRRGPEAARFLERCERLRIEEGIP
jgi:hypothetical protein